MKPFSAHNRVVGLLGGSFNPAHEGHLAITLYALKKLKLDEVVWLVSPQNPLKEKQTLADYKMRFDSALAVVAGHPRIAVSDLEQRKNFTYTYQTIHYLKTRYPRTRFVWLMGADNLAGFDRWQRWDWLLENIPIAVFDRAPFLHTALRHKTALRAQKFMMKNNQINRLWVAPSLHVAYLKRDPNSSTALRKTLGKRAFLRHNNHKES